MAARTLFVLGLVVLTGGCMTATPPKGSTPAAALRPAALLEPPELVVSRMFTAEDFQLESGQVLPHLTLAYETYGRLAPDGRNAILVTHGFTSSHHAAGRYAATDPTAGWWDGLIGPGKAIDTDRYFVVSSNMLGSSYGSTAPASIDPRTGRRYGPEFPDITVRDIVAAQRLLLAKLGVKRLMAVAGPSYGGFQAFQWAVTYPDFMQGIVAVVTAPKAAGGPGAVTTLVKRFAADPNWNSGWHYDRGGIPATMTGLRLETLKRYGQNEILAVSIADPQQREARMREMAVKWAGEFDPNSMVALRKASVRFDAESHFSKIQAKVLYVLSRTDQLFPPSIAPVVMDRLARAGVEAQYVEIDTEFGHQASGIDWAKWAPALKTFLEKLER